MKNIINRYGTIISFNSNFLNKVTDTEKMYKILKEFNNEINELKSHCFARQDEDIDDVIENTSFIIIN